MRHVGDALLVLCLCAVAGLAGAMWAQGWNAFEDCPSVKPGGLALYRVDTRYSRTCVFHPPVYGRAQHKLEMKRKERST